MDNDSSGEFEGEEPDESNDMAQDDEDEGSDDERQTKHKDPPKEITTNIPSYSQKEMRKPLKKREPTACGLIQMPSGTSYYCFEHKLLSKLATLVKVAVVSAEDVQIEFLVPWHVSNYVQLDDKEAYKVMVAAAIKCKDPKINLAVVQLQENDGKDLDTEDDKKKKKKKDMKKSKIPSENDISVPNAEINAKIRLLRTKYMCHANNGSDYCWTPPISVFTSPISRTYLVDYSGASQIGLADPENPFASSTKLNSSTPTPNESWTWGVVRFIGVDLGAGSSSNPACHRAAVLQQSPPTSSESSLSTVMRADGTPQAKLEEHCGTFITECVDAASAIALWTVLWCNRYICYLVPFLRMLTPSANETLQCGTGRPSWLGLAHRAGLVMAPYRCKFDIENKYRPPDDEKMLSPVSRRLLTENIFMLVPYGTSFIKNKTF
ncbi:hypothetical protein B0H14DRAFT_3168707 [Mycena olivaceomarginata]|nr:hypothetical protein B0H14DRAFT_3168707 [Mycena olivaceomarginata]